MNQMLLRFRKKISARSVSVVLTFLMAAGLAVFTILGRCLAKTQSLDFFLLHPQNMRLSILEFFIYLAVYYCLIYLIYYSWDHGVFSRFSSSNGNILRFVDTHSFLAPWIFIMMAWLPYLICYYPGIFMGDTAAQIKQVFQIPSTLSNAVKLISENQLITNHHPVVHTLMLGGFVKLGRFLFHSDNVGIFMYTLLQYISCSAVLAYSVSYMKKLRSPRALRILALFLLAFYPVFPRYAILLSKDAYFACFLLLFELLLLDFAKNPEKFKEHRFLQFALFFAMLGTMLFRQNGILAVIFSFPVLLLCRRNRGIFRRMALVFLAAVIFYSAYSNLLLPAFSITPGSRREVLSIPFQQTASYINKHANEITQDEYEAINGILDYETIKEDYNPNLSDPVKNTFNESATSKDLANYFRVWFSMFLKHPGSYIEATLNNYYGYLYIGRTADKHYVSYYMDKSSNFMEKRINKKGFSFHHIAAFRPMALRLEKLSDDIFDSYFFIFESSGFYGWFLLLALVFMIRKRNYQYLTVLLPALSILLVCFISPANGIYYFRYSFPLAYLSPLILSMCMEEPEESTITNSKKSKIISNYPLTS